MARIKLTMSPDYVSCWGFWEAFREVLQNVIDNCNENEKEQIFNYDATHKVLTIGSKETKLDKRTLLLGNTTKSENEKSIGKYGEGYKLALLILTRMGKNVTVNNADTVWNPKIIKSRTFDSELLVIDIEKGDAKNKDLTFEIHGVTKEEFDDVLNKVLLFHTDINKIETPYGDVLLDEKYKNQVYVEGLFVSTMKISNMRYGYSIKAPYLSLDRDRRTVGTFNLFWETSKMYDHLIRENKQEYKDLVHELIESKDGDAEYLNTHSCTHQYSNEGLFKDLCDMSAERFFKTHGTNAIVAKDEIEAKAIRERYNDAIPVIIPEKKISYISTSSSYIARKSSLTENDIPTPFKHMDDFFVKHGGDMEPKMYEEFKKLIEMSRNWSCRKQIESEVESDSEKIPF